MAPDLPHSGHASLGPHVQQRILLETTPASLSLKYHRKLAMDVPEATADSRRAPSPIPETSAPWALLTLRQLLC